MWMSRFFLAAVAVVASLCFSAPTPAAPLGGRFTVEIVFAPDCVSTLNAFDVILPCDKVSDTIMKFEADLLLRLTISGLEVGSTTVFTFRGLEFQAFDLATTIGALTIRDTFIFSPSITEIEYMRDSNTLSLRYCINLASPGDVTPPFLDCPTPDDRLYFLMEDKGIYHPTYQNLVLATIFDAANMLNNPLLFRKKIIELSLNIAGLTLSSRALFANLGTVATPSYSAGLIVSLEGQTVSGISVRAETWIGARQGLECFAECKPLEVYRVGKVLSPQDFAIQEEKIFIRNVMMGGLVFNFRAEFQFFTQSGSSTPNPGISFVQIDWYTRPILSLNVSFSNQLRLGPDLNPRYDLLQTVWRWANLSVTSAWIFYVSSTNTWEAQLSEITATFDPPGFSITHDLLLCTEILFAGYCTGGMFQHALYISASTGSILFHAKAAFVGFWDFTELWVDATFQAGSIELICSTVLKLDYLAVARLSTSIKF
jgi:hypothetical protein